MQSPRATGVRAYLVVCTIVWFGACSSGTGRGSGGTASGGQGGLAGRSGLGGVGGAGHGAGGGGGTPATGGAGGGRAGGGGHGGGADGGGGDGGRGGVGGAAGVGSGGGAAGGAGAAPSSGGAGGQGGGGAGGGAPIACAAAPHLMDIVGGTRCPGTFDALPASPSAVEVWLSNATGAGGGYRVMLNSGTAMTVGGHSYAFDSGDTLFGTGSSDGVGPAVIGTLALSVDGRANEISFAFGGCGLPGTPPTSVAARVTIMRGGISQTVMRTYAVTAPGAGTPWRFTSAADAAGCSTGVDLLGITF